jgi:hypothetical protein
MKIQFNTDKTINGDERNQDFFSAQIADALERYKPEITRIEFHVSDENGEKEGIQDIRCLLEARLENRQPFVVSYQADNIELAVSGAIDKLKAALKSVLGRISNH